MTPWEASFNGVKAQAINSNDYHVNELLPILITSVNQYISLADYLQKRFATVVNNQDYFDDRLMLVTVSIPAWTRAEYLWAFDKVTSKLKNTLLFCLTGDPQLDQKNNDIQVVYQRKDHDRDYLIGSLGYTSLAKIIDPHYEIHQTIVPTLREYINALSDEYRDVINVDSDLLRCGIDLVSKDLIYLWRQSFYILKQVNQY